MKKIFAVCLLCIGSSVYAKEAKLTGTLQCAHSSSYLLSVGAFSLKLDEAIDSSAVKWEEKDATEISWSKSQCEDSSTITANEKELAELMAGKTKEIWAELKQDDPNTEARLQVKCRYKK